MDCLVFDLEIDKDVLRRVLAKYYRPDSGAYGPSWLTVLGHAKDSLWSIDLFRCESLIFKSHWVLVVMDQCTRRIIGFGVHAGAVDGPSLCRMLNRAIRGAGSPKYVSSDNDPLFRFHQWKARICRAHSTTTSNQVENDLDQLRRKCLVEFGL